jgi:hypothetical protein
MKLAFQVIGPRAIHENAICENLAASDGRGSGDGGVGVRASPGGDAESLAATGPAAGLRRLPAGLAIG